MLSIVRKIVIVASLLAFSLAAARGAYACEVDGAFSVTRTNLEGALNDYGRILADAESNDRACWEKASTALTLKVSKTPLSIWSQWLQAGNAALVFAAANRIGANGFATKELDAALRPINADTLAVGHEPPQSDGSPACQKASGNQCVDDFSVAAAGFAWAAAYKFRRGDPDGDVATLRSLAIGAMNDAFNEVCIRKDDATEFCNGTPAELESGAAKTLSLNHGQQMPSYGFGLMTSIASTVLGLEASQGNPNYRYEFPEDQKTIARGLAREMQEHVSNNAFTRDCIYIISRDQDGTWHTDGAVDCGGLHDHYTASMYELKEFYDAYFGGMPPGAYQADTNSFDIGAFNLLPDSEDRYSFGRWEYYHQQSYDWVVSRREYLPFDTVNPIGYVDQIDSNGRVSGWTCDQDAPFHSNRVDIYSDASPDVAAFAYATVASEQAVSNACGGGMAHRFTAQLPPWARGTSITAYGLDYTWYGFTQLPCSTTNCTWPDNPPAASFVLSCVGRACTADAGGSSDDVGISTYQWNWGDSQTGSGGPAAGHSFAVDGTYTVTLTVTDTKGQTGSTTRTVTVTDNPPVPRFTVLCTGRSCAADASASSDDLGIASYQWNWGDGQTGSGAAPTHNYTVSDRFTVVLTVTDSANQSVSISNAVNIDVAPTASFTIPCTGRVCTGNGSASSDDFGIVTYQWTWGDSQTSTGGPSKAHTYGSNGTYTVRLTVTDTTGQTGATTRSVTVTDNPPAPSFTVACTGRTCTTDAGASTDDLGIASYQWNWGDSQTSIGGPTATHTYTASGLFTVTLTLADTGGQIASTTRGITIDLSPTASFTYTCNGSVCTFNASTSSDDLGIVSYRWDYAAGGLATTTNPIINLGFGGAGTYPIMLTVTDTGGHTAAKSQSVTVTDAPPVARVTVTCVNFACSADASASTDDTGPLTYTYTWGAAWVNNGNGPFGQSVEWGTYSLPGTYTITVTVKDRANQTSTASQTVTVQSAHQHFQTVGVMKNNHSALRQGHVSTYGLPMEAKLTLSVAKQPIAGDWNGDHLETVGTWTGGATKTGTFVLASDNADGPTTQFNFGPIGNDAPVAGDWNGDGIDTIGVYENSTGTFYLRNSNTAGAADFTFTFTGAASTWLPIAGDWNGDGVDTVGLYDPATSTFYLRDSNTTGPATTTFVFGTPVAGILPVAGDWDGDGRETAGVYDPEAQEFKLRNSNTAGAPDYQFVFLVSDHGGKPMAGDWDGY